MNWAIIGYGNIAPTFIESLSQLKDETLYAIASLSKSKELRQQYKGVKVFDNYQALLEDKNIDAVYICTTHNLHKENVLAALKAGKHVLCEKPMGISEAEVEEMVNEVRTQNKFLMEAMWTRFLPAYRYFKEILSSGILGKIKFVQADFGFFSSWGRERRLYNPLLAGGSILDVGVYPIALVNDIFNELPSGISAFGDITDTGVDASCAVILQYKDSRLAQLFSSFTLKTKGQALIYGENGTIQMNEFWRAQEIILQLNGKTELIKLPYESTGFIHEIKETLSCINKSQIQSPLMSHKHSLQNAHLADLILKEITPLSF